VKRLGHFEFKTLRSSTIVRLLLAPQVKKLRKKYFTLRLRRRPYYFFTATGWERENPRNFSLQEFCSLVWLRNSSSVQQKACSSVWSWRPIALSTLTIDYEFQPMSDELSDTDVCSVGNGLALSTCTREPIHLNALNERLSRLYWRQTGRGRVRKHLKAFLRQADRGFATSRLRSDEDGISTNRIILDFLRPLLVNSLTINSVFINWAEHHGFLLMTTKIRVVPDVPWCWEARLQWPSFDPWQILC
jgi:hypothetical protein